MSKVKPVVAKTPKELAEALALPAGEAREWQVQHELAARLKETCKELTSATSSVDSKVLKQRNAEPRSSIQDVRLRAIRPHRKGDIESEQA